MSGLRPFRSAKYEVRKPNPEATCDVQPRVLSSFRPSSFVLRTSSRPTAAEDVALSGVAEAVPGVGQPGGGGRGDDGVAGQEVEAPASRLPLQPPSVAPHAEGVLEV